jgi:hypothetical protein
MAFLIKNFSPIGANAKRGDAPSQFSYKTTDTLATCQASGYFDSISTMLSIGDSIKVETVDSVSATTSITNVGDLIVKSNASNVVDTYDALTNKIYLTVTMADVSTAASVWVVAPVACAYTGLKSVINGAIATADAVITAEIAGTLVTNGGLTIATAGSAAGDVDSGTPTALNVLTAGQALEIITNGASTNTIIATFTVELTPTLADGA